MQSTASNLSTANAVGAGSLLRAGLIAAVVTTVANLLVYYLVPAIFGFALEIPLQGPGSAIEPLPAFMVILMSVAPALVATLLLAALYRFTARPVFIFRVVALVFLLLSLGGPFSLPVSLGVMITLTVMHVVAAAVIIYVLTTQRHVG